MTHLELTIRCQIPRRDRIMPTHFSTFQTSLMNYARNIQSKSVTAVKCILLNRSRYYEGNVWPEGVTGLEEFEATFKA